MNSAQDSLTPWFDRLIVWLFVVLLVLPVGRQVILVWTRGQPAFLYATDIDDFARISATELWQSDAYKNANVVVHEGWYFFNAEGDMQSFQGLAPLDESTLLTWKTAVEDRQRWLSKHGCVYLPLIVPEKQTVHSERLPPDILKARGVSRMDQWMALWSVNEKFILDLRHDMKSVGGQPLYHRDDTHWNHDGAYQAYAAVLHRLSTDNPSWRPLPRTEFEIRSATAVGDLLRMAGANLVAIPRRLLVRHGGWHAESEEFQWPTNMTPKTYSADWQQPQLYSCRGQEGVLLLIGDSFTSDKSHFFVTAMAEQFERTIVLNNNVGFGPTLHEIQVLVESNAVDVVLECRAERHLTVPFTP